MKPIKRRIIQIVMNPASEHNPYDEPWVLCDDGTIWRRYEYEETAVDGTSATRVTKYSWTQIDTDGVKRG